VTAGAAVVAAKQIFIHDHKPLHPRLLFCFPSSVVTASFGARVTLVSAHVCTIASAHKRQAVAMSFHICQTSDRTWRTWSLTVNCSVHVFYLASCAFGSALCVAMCTICKSDSFVNFVLFGRLCLVGWKGQFKWYPG
jgi:hypothetical protein